MRIYEDRKGVIEINNKKQKNEEASSFQYFSET